MLKVLKVWRQLLLLTACSSNLCSSVRENILLIWIAWVCRGQRLGAGILTKGTEADRLITMQSNGSLEYSYSPTILHTLPLTAPKVISLPASRSLEHGRSCISDLCYHLESQPCWRRLGRGHVPAVPAHDCESAQFVTRHGQR